jgi:1,4-dihydroxy-2-naphthoyl-CoA hydrolase
MQYEGKMEFSIEEVTDEYVISKMPITQGILNPYGTVHAGAMLWLADVTATVLALGSETIPEDGRGFPLAINLNANLLGNLRQGEIKAEARFVRKGKRVTVVRTEVIGDNGQLLAEVTTTHIPAG